MKRLIYNALSCCILALLTNVLEAQPQPVTFQLSYTNGASNAGFGVQDQTDPAYPVRIAAISGAGTQSSGQISDYFDLNRPIMLSVAGQYASQCTMSITPPANYGMVIDGVETNSYLLDCSPSTASNALITIMLVRQGPLENGNDKPLGDASTIAWGPMVSVDYSNTPVVPDIGPYIDFNLGSEPNGDAAPPLRIPFNLAAQGMINFLPPPSAGNLSYSNNSSSFTLTRTNMVVTASVTGTTGTDFDLNFTAIGGSAPFVRYEFRGGTVAKKVARNGTLDPNDASTYDAYVTQLIYSVTAPSSVLNTWDIDDWYASGQQPVRHIKAVRLRINATGYNDSYNPPTDPDPYLNGDTITVTDNGTTVSRTQQQYLGIRSEVYDDSGNYLGEAINWCLWKVIEGYDPNNASVGYVTQYSTDGSTKIHPDGTVRVVARYPDNSSETSMENWLNNVPEYIDGQGLERLTGNSTYLSTKRVFTLDSRWYGLDYPTSIVKRVGSTGPVLANAVLSYSDDTANGQTLVVETRNDYSDAANYVTTVTKKYHPGASDKAMRGRLYAVEPPDGTQKDYAYEHGTFAYGAQLGTGTFLPSSSGTDFRITLINGLHSGGDLSASGLASGSGTVTIEPIALVLNRSTAIVQIFQNGRLVRSEVRAFTGGAGTSPTFELLSWEEFQYTNAGRLLEHKSSSGADMRYTWVGARMTAETDETGVTTNFTSLDAADRVLTATRAAVGSVPSLTTMYSYGQTETITVGAAGGDQLSSSTTYDLGRRVTQRVAPGGFATNYTYSNGDRDVTETYFQGTTEQSQKTVTHLADGQISQVTGSAVVNEYHTYDFDASNRLRHTVNIGSAAGRSSIEVFDELGRIAEKRSNGFGSTGTIIAYQTYNAQGQLSRVRTVLSSGGVEQALSADHITQYDPFGAIIADGLDLDGTGSLEANGVDRFVGTTTALSKDAQGLWWNVVTKTSYTTNNSTAANQTLFYTLLNPSSNTISSTTSYDVYGLSNPTQDTVTIDPVGQTKKETIRHPDGSLTVKTSIAGLLISEQFFASDNTSSPQHTVTYGYDAQGRQNAVTDSRTGTANRDYVSGTSLIWKTHDATGAVVSTMAYDHAGRVYSVTDSNNSVTNSTYNGRGQVIQESGSGTYPVTYDYDAYGQKTTMRTYRNGLSGAADITNWTYDDNTGWLTAKIDAAATRDSNGNVTNAVGHEVTFNYTYDFTNHFKTVTRTWARGVQTITQYSLLTGDLTSVSYTDGTPSVGYIYNRDGTVSTITDQTGTRDFTYDHGQVSAEALDVNWYSGANGGANPGLVLTPAYESGTNSNHVNGRYAGYSLGYATGVSADLGKELGVSVGYDTADRTNSITANYPLLGSRQALSVPYSYQYYAQSGLWQNLIQGNYKLARTFEANRDVLTDVSATYGGTALATYDYYTNTAGQRQWAKQSGSAFSDLGTSYYRYTYDSIGEVTSAIGYLGDDPTSTATPLPGRNYGFGYDTIGNRLSSSVDSEQITYSSTNALNEYGSRGTLRTHVSGTVATGASVTVNGTSVGALTGNYWDIALGNFGQYAPINVAATLSGQSQNASVNGAFRPATESFQYDADGNLTYDAAWHYTYDAENRLTSITALTSWGAPNRSLTFTYDYMGRRVRKTATGPNSGDNYDHKYVYHDWALIAEIDAGTNQIIRSYVWGLESGPSGGGALILETTQTTTALTTYNIGYDGDGNVAAFIGQADGAVAAQYEYDPYGQLTRLGDPNAINNPFRFGTYYTDYETGLIYYGHRFYDPTQGRFINRDPSEEQGGLNLYGFVNDDPIDHWDRLGLRLSDSVNSQTDRDLPDLALSMADYAAQQQKAALAEVTGQDIADAVIGTNDTTPANTVEGLDDKMIGPGKAPNDPTPSGLSTAAAPYDIPTLRATTRMDRVIASYPAQFALGFASEGVAAVKGIGHAVIHPIDTATAIGRQIGQYGPGFMVKGLVDQANANQGMNAGYRDGAGLFVIGSMLLPEARISAGRAAIREGAEMGIVPAGVHPGAVAAASSEVSQASILRALRANGSPEALATSKLISRGRLDLRIAATDPLGQGAAGRYFLGTRKIAIAADAAGDPMSAAGFTAHEARHFLQRITPSTYTRLHEFDAYQWQRAADQSFNLSDSEIWQHIRTHPVYRNVPE